MSPIKLHVGVTCNNEDLESQAVLEWSVRKHASEDVEIVWMMNGHEHWAGWKTSSMRTPFSHYRWSIPAVCDYEGRAIYSDSDFMFLGDIAELWNEPISDPAILLAKNAGKMCCILFDCEKARGHVPGLKALKASNDPQGQMSSYFKKHEHLLAKFTTGDWNVLDGKGYEDIRTDPRVKACHYTRMEHQCHLPYAVKRLKAEGKAHWYKGPIGPHPRKDVQEVFDELLQEAIANGYPPERYRVKPFGKMAKRDFVYKHSRVAS